MLLHHFPEFLFISHSCWITVHCRLLFFLWKILNWICFPSKKLKPILLQFFNNDQQLEIITNQSLNTNPTLMLKNFFMSKNQFIISILPKENYSCLFLVLRKLKKKKHNSMSRSKTLFIKLIIDGKWLLLHMLRRL